MDHGIRRTRTELPYSGLFKQIDTRTEVMKKKKKKKSGGDSEDVKHPEFITAAMKKKKKNKSGSRSDFGVTHDHEVITTPVVKKEKNKSTPRVNDHVILSIMKKKKKKSGIKNQNQDNTANLYADRRQGQALQLAQSVMRTRDNNPHAGAAAGIGWRKEKKRRYKKLRKLRRQEEKRGEEAGEHEHDHGEANGEMWGTDAEGEEEEEGEVEWLEEEEEESEGEGRTTAKGKDRGVIQKNKKREYKRRKKEEKQQRRREMERGKSGLPGGHCLASKVCPISYDFDVDPSDHCETPLAAYRDLEHVLKHVAKRLGKTRETLEIYDPYFCEGGVKRHLKSLGWTNVYNENEDCYLHWYLKEFDIMVTNPPYSEDHVYRLFEFIASRPETPFCILLPNFFYTKPKLSETLGIQSMEAIKFLIPPGRYKYDPPRSSKDASGANRTAMTGKTAPFVSLWYLINLPQEGVFSWHLPNEFKPSEDKSRRKNKKKKGNGPKFGKDGKQLCPTCGQIMGSCKHTIKNTCVKQ